MSCVRGRSAGGAVPPKICHRAEQDDDQNPAHDLAGEVQRIIEFTRTADAPRDEPERTQARQGVEAAADELPHHEEVVHGPSYSPAAQVTAPNAVNVKLASADALKYTLQARLVSTVRARPHAPFRRRLNLKIFRGTPSPQTQNHRGTRLASIPYQIPRNPESEALDSWMPHAISYE